jgi:hypothetical protein
MDSMRHDLRDALDELRPEVIQATVAVAAEEQSCGYDGRTCTKCGYPPANNDKLRYCGLCAAVVYCSKLCAKEHWTEHKLVCDIARNARAKALANHEARGGRKQDFNQLERDTERWFMAVPGLLNEIQLMAWAHRDESPFIQVISTSRSDADSSDMQVKMIPRSFWDVDPRLLDTSAGSRETLRQHFGKASFCSSKEFLFVLTRTYPDGDPGVNMFISSSFDDQLIRGAEIADALSTATKAEDLADAFAWFENAYPSSKAQQVLQHINNRASSVHGDTTLQGSVPDPSRALNVEVAYMIFDGLDLEFDVCLTGLRGATHLNGRQGSIRGPEPGSNDRWKVRLDDSNHVAVKAINLAHIRRWDYKCKSP